VFDPDYDQLGLEAEDNLKMADKYFTQISHLRGMAQTNCLLMQIYDDQAEEMKEVYGKKDSSFTKEIVAKRNEYK